VPLLLQKSVVTDGCWLARFTTGDRLGPPPRALSTQLLRYATHSAGGRGRSRAPVMRGAAGFGRWQGETPGRLAAHAVEADRASGCALSALTPAVPVLIVGLQDADKIGHAGSVPIFGHNRNPSIGPGLAPLPNPQ
jgi:hypothetical protein